MNVAIKDPKITLEMVETWYEEHASDVLSSEGCGGLFLRYRNINPSAVPDVDLSTNLASRLDPSSSGDEIQEASWPYLAIVKVSDLDWYHSEGFQQIPLASQKLNPDPEGEPVSAFDGFHAALRSYVTAGGEILPGMKWPKYFVAVQVSALEDSGLDELEKKVASMTDFRGGVRYQFADGHLAAQELGNVPPGLIMYHFDGNSPPAVRLEEYSGVVKQDIWQLTMIKGDHSLSI